MYLDGTLSLSLSLIQLFTHPLSITFCISASSIKILAAITLPPDPTLSGPASAKRPPLPSNRPTMKARYISSIVSVGRSVAMKLSLIGVNILGGHGPQGSAAMTRSHR